MLFNSYIFILFFMPCAVAGYYLCDLWSPRMRRAWLLACSILFYAWGSCLFLGVLLGSVCLNFLIGRAVGRYRSRTILACGVGLNLLLLGYYKYFWFFLSSFFPAEISENYTQWSRVALPLGLSFITFQQLAYLVDTYRQKTVPQTLGDHFQFILFFPVLLAGPLVRQAVLMPQLMRDRVRFDGDLVGKGLFCFILGLCKKLMLADVIGRLVAGPVFEMSTHGSLSFPQAWYGALGYTLQLYFDFSSYSDMAIGVALMLGVVLPPNFMSPYKALSISDFWRRWHMTLSQFLRDYVYIPLGGNRKGPVWRYSNLMITMLLGGLWHGAGWTFIIWGGLHGLYLCVNHFWSAIQRPLPRFMAWGLTFVAVIFAWVVFRAETLESALLIWRAMLWPFSFSLQNMSWGGGGAVIAGFCVLFLCPSIPEWLEGQTGGAKIPLIGRWTGSALQGLVMGGLLWFCCLLIQFSQSEFLYFNF